MDDDLGYMKSLQQLLDQTAIRAEVAEREVTILKGLGLEKSHEIEQLITRVGFLQGGINKIQTLLDQMAIRAEVVERERDEAREWVRRVTHERCKLTCAFCGQEYPPGTAEANDDALMAHIAICTKHPMRVVEKERDEARTLTFNAIGKARDSERQVERVTALLDERPDREGLAELIWRSFYQKGPPCCEWREVDEDLKEMYRRTVDVVSVVVELKM